MEFRISDTFTDSLARLSGDEQKLVKTTVFDLQTNPANPGLRFHRIDGAKDRNFWSVRVSRDIRIIVHRTSRSMLLAYVDHHDDAYRWAQKRKIERHPKTGAAQLVEVRETIREVIVPQRVATKVSTPAKEPLFEGIAKDALLSYGVPEEWIDDVYAATEDTIFQVAEHLPQEAAEALLELATGGQPKAAQCTDENSDPFEHPDAQRRFRVMAGAEELRRALDYPWEKWSVFLHPAQREIVERRFSGPARISGSAGTGKTIVALHRAVFLARKNKGSRVLLTTFSETLANALRRQRRRLIDNEPRLAERLEVHSIEGIGKRLYENNFGRPNIARQDEVIELLKTARDETKHTGFTERFLWSEWSNVIDARQLETWEEYKNVKRYGRKKRLAEGQREKLWAIFACTMKHLERRGLITPSRMFTRLAERLKDFEHPPFEHVVIDEAQDISVAQLRFLASIGGDRQDNLFFTGDLGQRIFQQPFSWKSLGVEIRGRSKTLKVNYRTSHQIRSYADRLLPSTLADVDENLESRDGTISVFEGAVPAIRICNDQDEEIDLVRAWVKGLLNDGYQPHEIGLFVRSDRQLARAQAAVKPSGAPFVVLDENMATKSGHLSISTMHNAKGLEFRAVCVMCCDDEVLPMQERIESAGDEYELEDVYQTERHLLYVACTRARDNLLVTGIDPASEFLDDLTMSNKNEIALA